MSKNNHRRKSRDRSNKKRNHNITRQHNIGVFYATVQRQRQLINSSYQMLGNLTELINIHQPKLAADYGDKLNVAMGMIVTLNDDVADKEREMEAIVKTLQDHLNTSRGDVFTIEIVHHLARLEQWASSYETSIMTNLLETRDYIMELDKIAGDFA